MTEMNLFVPKSVPLNWYRFDVPFSLELIGTFVKSVEQQAVESITRYHTEKELIEHHDEMIEVHDGLDSSSWDLEKVFTEHFPSLQRRSALITLHSFFETELDKLCELYRQEKHLDVAFSDLKGTGIDRSTLYLEKVVGLNVHKQSTEWAAIRNIQAIRNCVVHRDARVDENQDKAIINFINASQSLSRNAENEIVIGEGFLAFVLSTYGNYFHLIGQSIALKDSTKSTTAWL